MVNEYQYKLGPKEGPYVVCWKDENGNEMMEERLFVRKHKAFKRRDTLRRRGFDAYVIGRWRIVDESSVIRRNEDEVDSEK